MSTAARRSLWALALLALACLACSALTAVSAARIPAALQSVEHAARGSGSAAAVHTRADDDDDDDDNEPLLTHEEALKLEHEDETFCFKKRYRKTTLKVVKEAAFIGLFDELQGQRRFEASGVTFAKGYFWVIFDNLEAFGKIDLHFDFRDADNELIGPTESESQFEGLSYMPESDNFLAVRESMQHERHGLVPQTIEIHINKGEKYHVIRRCPVDFLLEDENKGFESIHTFVGEGDDVDANGNYTQYMFGLCESNFCKTILGPDPPGKRHGNGRMVWARFVKHDEYQECSWEVVKVIHLPRSAYFEDYSAIAFNERKGRNVLITSQEDAAVWVGEFDWDAMEFVHEVGQVYHFPRDHECRMIYCNVEGVGWLDASRIILTSDRSKAIQDHRCMDKDQSVHVMALP